jgi:hypothetical protein
MDEKVYDPSSSSCVYPLRPPVPESHTQPPTKSKKVPRLYLEDSILFFFR